MTSTAQASKKVAFTTNDKKASPIHGDACKNDLQKFAVQVARTDLLFDHPVKCPAL